MTWFQQSICPVCNLSWYELRRYGRDKQAGQCQDILSFIHSGNVTCRLNQNDLHGKLKTGQAIALFDGIDEVFDPTLRDQVVTDIHRFTNFVHRTFLEYFCAWEFVWQFKETQTLTFEQLQTDVFGQRSEEFCPNAAPLRRDHDTSQTSC